MDTRLQIVERLYEEGDVNHVPRPSESDSGEDLTPEFQAMSQVKFWMDHRRRQRPEPATIDQVVAAAGAASRGEMPGIVRADRSPLRLLNSPRLRMAVAATFVVGIAAVGVWRSTVEPGVQTDLRAKSELPMDRDVLVGDELAEREKVAQLEEPAEESKNVAPALAKAYRPANEAARRDAEDDSSMRAGRASAPAPTIVAAAATKWDESDDVIRLRQRIDLLRSRQAGEAWDKPVVPLEMMPTNTGAAGIRQAGSSGN